MRQIMMMCPHCGWKYDTEKHEDGMDLVPTHVHDYSDDNCPGSKQSPRNPSSDRRPLWNGKEPA